jgi:hypothetical protein
MSAFRSFSLFFVIAFSAIACSASNNTTKDNAHSLLCPKSFKDPGITFKMSGGGIIVSNSTSQAVIVRQQNDACAEIFEKIPVVTTIEERKARIEQIKSGRTIVEPGKVVIIKLLSQGNKLIIYSAGHDGSEKQLKK